MEFAKAANCKFTAGQVLELMVLFPFFAVKNGHNFAKSILGYKGLCASCSRTGRRRPSQTHTPG